jgi:hypothetical protein
MNMFGTQTERIAKATLMFIMVVSLFFVVKIINEVREGSLFTGGVPHTTITVYGEGEAFAVPDIATFSFSVESRKATVKAAQDEAAESINEALQYLEDAGVDEKDIKTTDYSAYPEYEYRREEIVCITYPCVQPPGRQVLIGYRATQSISVKVRDIDEAGSILSGVGEFVDTVSGLALTVESENSVKREARQMAIDDAKAKAKELSKDLGVRLVRVVSFNESGSTPSPMFFGTDAVAKLTAPEEAVPDLPAGENQFTSNVTITYQIK